MSSSVASLFQPLRVGTVDLQHRVVMAPLTRLRANKDHVLGELAKTYYTQRSSVPGTLIISEATIIAPQATGYSNVPGIWSDAQIASWKLITDAVHANGSYMKKVALILVAPSPIPLENNVPRELTVAEIKEYVQLYSKAASNAIKAGLDGVEIHVANGCLPDQFLQTVSNERTDEYGGSLENRVRFPLEVVKALVKTVGAERTAVRLSPWSKFQGMGMKDPLPTFTTFVERIRDEHPNLAYIHVIEPRVSNFTVAAVTDENRVQSNEELRKIWGDRPYIVAGGMDRATAIDTGVESVKAFLRLHPQPDLPLRLKEGVPLTGYNRDTFYVAESAAGYS
ncbi:hypothetical protein EDB83DRAFT_2533590 [Lactarius deliciosus]|nr:hypothetical protein EDB83DRAFT_2533590 [Lactarius deliciosus]